MARRPKETKLLSLEHTFLGEIRVELRSKKNAVWSAWHRQHLLGLDLLNVCPDDIKYIDGFKIAFGDQMSPVLSMIQFFS